MNHAEVFASPEMVRVFSIKDPANFRAGNIRSPNGKTPFAGGRRMLR